MKRLWELKQSADASVLELYIYGDVEGDGYDWWRDEVIESETSANHFRDALAAFPNAAEIRLYINSNGGSVFEGTAIYNQLRRHPAKKTVYIDGFACSVASVIAMAGDEIVMPRNAMMMVHHAMMGVFGNARELRKAADDLDAINKGNRQAYLQKAGDKLTEEKLIELLDNETWLTAEECMELGLADRYAEQDADMAAAAAIFQKTKLNLEQRIRMHQALAAQLRELTREPEPPKDQTIPPAEDPEPENEPTDLMQVLSGMFKN